MKTVAELIRDLSQLPEDAPVACNDGTGCTNDDPTPMMTDDGSVWLV